MGRRSTVPGVTRRSPGGAHPGPVQTAASDHRRSYRASMLSTFVARRSNETCCRAELLELLRELGLVERHRSVALGVELRPLEFGELYSTGWSPGDEQRPAGEAVAA